MSVSKADVIEFLKNMTVLELSELIKELEETFGVSAAAPVAMAIPGAGVPGEAAPAVEEQTEFTVVLVDAGAKKIDVIKEVRAIVSGLGLKEAKDLVEGAPQNVKESVTKEEAEKYKKQLEAVGAKVDPKYALAARHPGGPPVFPSRLTRPGASPPVRGERRESRLGRPRSLQPAPGKGWSCTRSFTSGKCGLMVFLLPGGVARVF
jgi:large subunit ribosomal protein L7/L12